VDDVAVDDAAAAALESSCLRCINVWYCDSIVDNRVVILAISHILSNAARNSRCDSNNGCGVNAPNHCNGRVDRSTGVATGFFFAPTGAAASVTSVDGDVVSSLLSVVGVVVAVDDVANTLERPVGPLVGVGYYTYTETLIKFVVICYVVV
jgi:hypothetical protein